MKANSIFAIIFLLVLFQSSSAAGKAGVPFNPLTDINWEEIELQVEGVCICPRPPPIFYVPGLIVSYWEPFLLEETVSVPFYSPMVGASVGSSLIDELGGKNKSSDSAEIANESTFAQAHGYLVPLMTGLCGRYDYGIWMTEYDALWQNDELSIIIHPEAALYANKVMQMACMADAAAVNIGWPLDFMPWCIGSSGSAYPMTGHVDNDNIVQANSTAAARLIYKLNRLFRICDPALNPCGCLFTPVWVKSHYKMHTVRPGIRWPAWPIGKSSKFYDTALNPPYMGALGSNDEFLWVVYRKQFCCTCCQ